MVNSMHVIRELPEVSRSPLRSGMTLVELPDNRRITNMRIKTTHLQQVQKPNPFPLHSLLEDIEFSMAKCRAMIIPSPEPDYAEKCFANLAHAWNDINEEIKRRSAE